MRGSSPGSPGRPPPLPTGPKIVHLGPVRSHLSASLQRNPTQGASVAPTVVSAVCSTAVRSSVLVHATYRRIRVVQQMMGYGLLLPVVEGEGADALGEVKTWTRREALEAVSRETLELMEEFDSNAVGDGENGSAVGDVEPIAPLF